MFYDDDGNEGMPTTELIPASLMVPYLYKNQILFTDNFYTSPSLAEYFLNHGTHLCGTVRSNRKHFCKDIIDVALEKGEASFYRSTNNNKIVVSKYSAAKDKSGNKPKIVFLLSTCHSAIMSETGQANKDGVAIRRPTMIKSYNSHMGGVDMVDQQLHNIDVLRKHYKWYKKVAFRLIMQAVLNSHKLFQFRTGNEKKTFLEFLQDVIASLAKQNELPQNYVPDDGRERLTGRHFPSVRVADEDAKDKRPSKNCRVCYAKTKRTDKGRPLKTVYICEKCPSQPGLHPDKCFEIYHTQEHFGE
ncbi:piggyBac transposable element-derived protein 4-like [Hydractinia symbiolongicarpus]|uniref:piggyBac transposable element-derived protein 4-like n=1 Tax=Hydractinia symbiolongicarpus TaxID=13093 RepID=UPI00254BF36D|nr:piggyBac transposable element-derived protein 4-like [Hydractinia symbiolongicarpus]